LRNDPVYISQEDLLLTLTLNKSRYKEDLVTLTAKTMFIKEYIEVDLNRMSYNLHHLNIDRLNIFCIEKNKGIKNTYINNNILLIELGVEDFRELLNNPKDKFIEFNKNSLYIIRDTNYTNVKALFSVINNLHVNIGRGGGQKNHIFSPLEFRFFSYIMAMFNFKYPNICYLNNFRDITKDRYLPFHYNKNK